MFSIFFFFQAEDGIRDYKVTGVQTCALPISRGITFEFPAMTLGGGQSAVIVKNIAAFESRYGTGINVIGQFRSEERRVGKECRSRGWRDRGRKEREVMHR